ncbi:MAG: ABC transporter substrate-binding protein [Oscillospiraceae bacterium]|nr:ABC transporter substrate-binding protein [Oscillospiraceae bacterium]
MKNSAKIVCLVLALVMCLSLCACGSKNKGAITVATSPDFPPFENLEGGKIVGIEVDIVNKIGEKLGKEIKYEQMDFDSVLAGIQAGKFDMAMSGITVTEERQKNANFTSPYFMASQAIVVTKDSPITCKADLEGKSVSVQTGTTAEEYCMDNGYDVKAFTANNDACLALTTGKVDAWVVDNEVAVAFVEDQADLVVLSEAMTQEPYAFAFKKGNDELTKAVNDALVELIKDGTVEKIFDSYGVPYVAPVL